MIKIGNIELDIPLFQAPLSGYSDSPMRVMARQFGAPLTFAGLMLDASTAFRKIMCKPEFAIDPSDHPIGGQLLGSEPEIMTKAAITLEESGFDVIDLNFACPAPKVLRRGRGGALMKDPRRAISIMKMVRNNISRPMSVKIRRGFNNSEQSADNYWELCEGAVAVGIDALVVHGRTVTDHYRGKADWDIVVRTKKRFPDTLVFGSGDIFSAADVQRRLADGLIDGVIIARGAIGNPWIFSEARAILQGKPLPEPPDVTEQGAVMKRHFELVRAVYHERKVVAYFRKFAVRYCKRHPERKKVQMQLITDKTSEAVLDSIKQWYGV